MKLLLLLPLLILGLSLMPSSASAQEPTELECAASDFRCQLKQSIDINTDLRKQLATVGPLIEAVKAEREAAANERAAAQREREAADRTIKLGDQAIAAQQKALDTYEKVIVPAYDKLIEKQTARIDKLEDRVDKANKRTVLGTLGGLFLGIVTKVF